MDSLLCVLSDALLCPFLGLVFSLFSLLSSTLLFSIYTASPQPAPWDGVYTCCRYSAEGHAWRRETRGPPPTYTHPLASPPPRVDLLMTCLAVGRPSFPRCTSPGWGQMANGGPHQRNPPWPGRRTMHPPNEDLPCSSTPTFSDSVFKTLLNLYSR